VRSLRVRPWLLGVAGVALAILDLVLTLTSDHAQFRGLNGSLGALTGVAFVGTGVFAWSRRPGSRVGPLMVATGFAWLGAGLSQANSPLLFSIGMAFGPLYLVLVSQLVLAFPDGRIKSPLARRLLVAGYVDVLVIYEAWWLLDGRMDGDHPDNVLAIVHAPGVAGVFDVASPAIGALTMATVVVLLLRERRRATPVVRHAIAPVLWTGLVCIIGTSLSLGIGATSVSDLAMGMAGAVAMLAFLLLPFAFLTGILRTRYAHAGVVSELVGALSSRAALRDTLADALGDPSLRLVYRTGSPARWVDLHGHPVELPAAGVTEVERDGSCIGAIIHDPQLDHERELVQAVAAAAALAMENERLEAELRARRGSAGLPRQAPRGHDVRAPRPGARPPRRRAAAARGALVAGVAGAPQGLERPRRSR
jgi:hypothetical protein